MCDKYWRTPHREKVFLMVVDGQESRLCDSIFGGSPQFPGDKTITFVAAERAESFQSHAVATVTGEVEKVGPC